MFTAIVPEGIVDGIRGGGFGAVMGQVPYVYANTKQRVVRKCICVLHLKVSYAWKQVGVDKNVVSSSWLCAVVRYACGLTCWLPPVAGHGSDVGPTMVEKQVVYVVDVLRLCIYVSKYASGALGLGALLTSYSLHNLIGSAGLLFVLSTASMAPRISINVVAHYGLVVAWA